VPVTFAWGYFHAATESFPEWLLDALIARAGLPGVLGNCRASGTTILDELGEEHLRTGKPIVYTSADSVLQIAAHETRFGLQRLYDTCAIARELADRLRVARVIARPFRGERAGAFRRTPDRHDWSVPPPAPTLLDHLVAAGREVVGIGKIPDLFTGRGITRAVRAHGIGGLFEAAVDALDALPDGGLAFVNFVDFDQEYGHRRDPAGYARALEDFDERLPAALSRLRRGDLLLLTADHGNDPTAPGTDHTREHVPVLAVGPDLAPRSIGIRDTFADVGQTLAAHLRIPPLDHGLDCLSPA
jgi:phosphopentomutase